MTSTDSSEPMEKLALSYLGDHVPLKTQKSSGVSKITNMHFLRLKQSHKLGYTSYSIQKIHYIVIIFDIYS